MMAQLSTGSSEIIALRHGYSGRSMLAQSLTGALLLARAADAGRRHQARDVALLLPLPAEADVPTPAASPAPRTSRSSSARRRPAASPASSPSRSRASEASSRRRPSTSRSPSASSRSTAASSSATRSRPASAAPAGRWWGIEHWGVQPDIMTMAKGIANGLPLGVTIATPEIAAALEGADDLDVRRQPGLLRGRQRDRSDHRGGGPASATPSGWARSCGRGSKSCSARFPKNIGDVRGMGLMQAIEFVVDETAGDRTPDKAMTQPRLRGGQEARSS